MTLVELQTFIGILRTQSTDSVELDLPKFDLLVAVAVQPGLTAQEYGRIVNSPESSVNRHLRELREGQTGRQRPKRGLGLIVGHSDPNDWRKISVHLSRKGQLLIDQVLALGSKKPG